MRKKSGSLSPEMLPVIGWREWVSLNQLGLGWVKAKVDTGARSSALHAFDIHTFEEGGHSMVSFKVHPHQRDTSKTVTITTEMLERRHVRSSNGRSELRPVIRTQVQISGKVWLIELTLTNRSLMGFRLLLGRQALRGRFLVDSSQSFLQSARPD